MKFKDFFRKIANLRWLPDFIALLGGITFLYQSIQSAIFRTSFLDEGLYLYKGWLFASGQFQPFADYGPWTNQMPLSYYIPGIVQTLFGPGLRAGRYFAIFLGILMILALWLVTRRLANRWWAAGIVWALALNIASIKIYSLAISEVVVACLFAWMLYFILGEDRPTWQIVVGSILAVAIFLVRINMLPLIGLVVLYIFWQHGQRKGWIALGVTGGVFLLGHALYWPEILKIWAAWLPDGLTPFLNPFRLTSETGKWVTSAALPDFLERILYFFLSFRLHLLSLGGALFVWLLWPGGANRWKSVSQFRVAVFLSVTLLLLLVMHFLAAFFLGFCISCVLLYIAFFDFLGLLLLAQSFSALRRTLPLWRSILAGLIIFLLGIGMAFSLYGDIARPFIQRLAKLISWDLNNFFLWPIFLNLGIAQYNVYQIRAALVAGTAVVSLIFISAFLIYWLIQRKNPGKVGYIYVLTLLILGLGFIFSPTPFQSGGNDFFSCNHDIIHSYEQAGATLNATIPPGSDVFWIGRIPALLLYLEDVNLFLPQLNHYHNFRTGGDDGELEKFGLWNESLGRKWFAEADAIVVEEEWLDGWVKEEIEQSGLSETIRLPKIESCRKGSRIFVYLKPASLDQGLQP